MAWVLAGVLALGGCTGKSPESGNSDNSGDVFSSGMTEYQFLEEGNVTESVSVEENTEKVEYASGGKNEVITGKRVLWEDNTVDDYYAFINQFVEKVETEGEISGGGRIFVNEGGCVRHGNHNYASYTKDWDGINGITADAFEYHLQLEVDTGREGNQIDDIGPISGQKGYVTCFYIYENGKPSEYWLYKLDDRFQVVDRVHADLTSQGFVRSIMGDANGNFHITYDSSSGMKKYVVLSQYGKILFEDEVKGRVRLCAFDEGRVALSVMEIDGLNERWFYEADLEKGVLAELAFSKDENVRRKIMEYVMDATPLDEKRIALCTEEALLIYDLAAEEWKIAYQWSNHGLVPTSVEELTVMGDGSIAMTYKEKDDKGYRYLLLKPTTEKKELKSITIAVSAENKDLYTSAAAYFNKLYPEYVINIEDNYENMRLLTQLGAGDGPVLVDTKLTGFEELENLWQPLDGFLEQTGIAEKMIPEALEFGKIGDVTYGIVRDFRMETMLVAQSGPQDWDYKGFIKAAEDSRGALFTYRAIESPTDLREWFFGALQNGLRDNYYFDAETGNMIFGTQEFERLLDISGKAVKCPSAENGKALQEGSALCEHLDLLAIAEVFRLRRRVEANGERVIGYPTGEGARTLLVAREPLALRATATEEEKIIAYTFLKVFLSKEAMMTASGILFPVRKDVLEEKITEYENSVESLKETEYYDPVVMPELDREKDVEFLMNLIHKGTVKKSLPIGLKQIFDEEFEAYLNGRMEGKQLENHLKSRVWIYLEETK